MNPNFTFTRPKNIWMLRMTWTLTLLMGLGFSAISQTCTINVTGCPPNNVSLGCATKAGAPGQPDSGLVNWTVPNFTLNCGTGGVGYNFQMLWDRPENTLAGNCWDFNFVQRTGGGGSGNGTLNLWKSNGTVPPYFATPNLFFTGSTDLRIDLYAEINYTLNAYLFPIGADITNNSLGTLVWTLPVLAGPNLVTYTTTINPAPGTYRLKYEFTTAESYNGTTNYVDFVGINAILASSSCAGGIDFVVTGPIPPLYYAVGTTPVTYTATYTDASGGTITASCNFNVVVNGVTASVSNIINTTCGLNNGSLVLTATPSGSPTSLEYSFNAGPWTTFISGATIPGLPSGNFTLNVRANYAGGQQCSLLTALNGTIGASADLIDPSITCPSNIIQNTGTGVCTASVITPNPVTSDNCGVTKLTWAMTGATPGNSPATGINNVGTFIFNKGVTTVSYRVEDAAGNFATCNFTVTINDNQNPTITCVANQTRSTNSNVCTYTASGTEFNPATSGDNCPLGGSPLSYQLSGATTTGVVVSNTLAGVVFNKGITTVTWTITDASGNTATCNFTVTVNDTQKPTITCVANQTRNANTGVCTYSASGTEFNPTATGDNCPLGGSPLSYQLSGATTTGVVNAGTLAGVVFNQGTTTVTWTITDASANTETCSFTVLVNDNQNPTITCVANQTRNANTNVCTYTTTGTEFNPTATGDNCPLGVSPLKYQLSGATTTGVVTANTLAGVAFNKGITTVTWTITDASGNTATCNFTVTVNDTQNPTITCVANQTRNANTGLCTYTASGTEFNPTANGDNCPLGANPLTYQLSGATTTGVVVANTLSGVVFNKGITTVTWVITDASGNTATCNFTVTVNDNQNPTITCPSNITQNPATGLCTASVVTPNPTTGDNCGVISKLTWSMTGATVASSPATGINNIGTYTFNVGTTTVVYRVEDASGNFTTCTFTVTINPCAADLRITKTGPASVNSGAQINYTITVFNDGPGGATGVVITDNVPGTISNPQFSTNGGTTYSAWTGSYNVPGTIASGGSMSILLRGTLSAAACTSVSNTATVAGTLPDPNMANNTATATSVVIDVTPPSISCVSQIVVSADGSCIGVPVSVPTPNVTDNCTLPLTPVTGVRSDGKALNAAYPIGITTIVWTATDGNGNTATCTTTVRVNEGTILANYLFANVGNGSYPYPAEETATGITSNVTSSEPFNGTGSGAVETGDLAFKLNPGNNGALIMQPSSGENTRYFQFVVSGATLSQYGQFKVYFMAERNPQGAPLVTLRYSTDGVNYTDAGTMDVVQNQFNQKVFDLSAIAALNNYNLTTLYFRVYASGATSTSSAAATRLEIDNFQVFAKTRPPVATITAQTNVLCRGASTGSATAAGSLGFPPYTYSWNTNPVQTGATATNLAAGTYTVTVTDSKGCTGTAQVTITQPATAVSVDLVSQVNPNCLAPGAAAGSFTVAGAGGVPPYSYSRNDVDYSNTTGVFTGLAAGTYTVWARDANECKSSRQVTITESADVTAPTITTCPSAKSATVTAQACNAAVPNVIGEVVATDACTPANQLVITQSPAAGTLLGVGSHTIVVSVRDLVGNVRTCNVTFTVIDNINPVIVTCPAPQSGFANNTCRAAVPNFTTGVVATDNCSSGNSLQITQSPTAGTLVPLGTTTVTITVRDASNNTVTCTTTFTVTDNTPPTITCPANITTPDDGCGIASIALGTPVANDNCTTVTVAGVRSDGKPLTDPYPLGNTTITWTATDGVGLTATCTQTVTVTKSPGTILVNYTFVGLTGYPFNANETATGITSNVNTAEPFSPQNNGTSTGPLAFKQNIGTNEFLNMQPSDGENTRYFQFQISGENLKFYSQFKIYFQGSRQPQAADKINVAYSTDGVNYTFNGSLAIPLQREWYEALIDYSAIAALNGNNLSTLYIRLYVSGSTSTGGSDATRLEIDNFQVLAQGLGVVITCNAAISVNLTPPATCSAAVTLTPPAASSRCGTVTVTGSRSDGQPLNDPFPIGTTTITWTGVDPGGNSASCTQTVTVIGLVDAVDDMFVINTGVAGILGNVLSNDQLECSPVTPSNVVITVTQPSADPRVTINTTTGNVEGADGTPIGTYILKYRICEIGGTPARCDEATVTVVVEDRALPVTGLRLFGNRAGNDVNLNWVTVAEQNSSHFILERSLDGLNFAPIPVGNRVAAAGNSNNQRNYNQVDRNMVATVVYYRVRLYDNDGSFRMSNVVAVRMAQGREFRVYPNPVVNMVTIEFAENGTYRVDLLSASGQLIQVNREVLVTNSMNTITVPRNNIPAGMYELRVTNASTGKVSTVKLIYQPR